MHKDRNVTFFFISVIWFDIILKLWNKWTQILLNALKILMSTLINFQSYLLRQFSYTIVWPRMEIITGDADVSGAAITLYYRDSNKSDIRFPLLPVTSAQLDCDFCTLVITVIINIERCRGWRGEWWGWRGAALTSVVCRASRRYQLISALATQRVLY